jgi:hypothetical protein
MKEIILNVSDEDYAFYIRCLTDIQQKQSNLKTVEQMLKLIIDTDLALQSMAGAYRCIDQLNKKHTEKC